MPVRGLSDYCSLLVKALIARTWQRVCARVMKEESAKSFVSFSLPFGASPLWPLRELQFVALQLWFRYQPLGIDVFNQITEN